MHKIGAGRLPWSHELLKQVHGECKCYGSPVFHGRCTSTCECMRRIYHIKQVRWDVLYHGLVLCSVTQIVKEQDISYQFLYCLNSQTGECTIFFFLRILRVHNIINHAGVLGKVETAFHLPCKDDHQRPHISSVHQWGREDAYLHASLICHLSERRRSIHLIDCRPDWKSKKKNSKYWHEDQVVQGSMVCRKDEPLSDVSGLSVGSKKQCCKNNIIPQNLQRDAQSKSRYYWILPTVMTLRLPL
jgi:hypothetical protein